MSDDVLVAALIGAAGSVVGGLVGGWLALAAGGRQSKREAQARKADRSSTAALTIAESLATLEAAIVTYAAGDSDSVTLRIAFNVFSQATNVQILAITDRELRARIRNHVEWVMTFAAVASEHSVEKVMVEPMRRHADAVIDALDAHVNGRPLPAYDPPLLGDAAALMAWGV